MKRIFYVTLFCIMLVYASCTGTTTQKNNENEANASAPVIVPNFNADSAYSYIAGQVDFGPRVPNTEAHKACAAYLAAELRRFGAEVTEQKANLKAYDNTTLEAVNIIGSFNPELENRILLFAHWDSRPVADHDPNPDNHTKPVMGANDGASGVGVLLEMARLIGQDLPTVGVDIIFFDAEDYGQPAFDTGKRVEDSWCLGSQYWAKNPHKPGYHARYGILLDMVGDRNASFPKESHSVKYAPHVVKKVWDKAKQLGYSGLFIDIEGGAIIDDHLYVNQLIGIPSIDIIDIDSFGFPDQWHTVDDTMEHIDKGTLKAVGQTLLEVIYNEK